MLKIFEYCGVLTVSLQPVNVAQLADPGRFGFCRDRKTYLKFWQSGFQDIQHLTPSPLSVSFADCKYRLNLTSLLPHQDPRDASGLRCGALYQPHASIFQVVVISWAICLGNIWSFSRGIAFPGYYRWRTISTGYQQGEQHVRKISLPHMTTTISFTSLIWWRAWLSVWLRKDIPSILCRIALSIIRNKFSCAFTGDDVLVRMSLP